VSKMAKTSQNSDIIAAIRVRWHEKDISGLIGSDGQQARQDIMAVLAALDLMEADCEAAEYALAIMENCGGPNNGIVGCDCNYCLVRSMQRDYLARLAAESRQEAMREALLQWMYYWSDPRGLEDARAIKAKAMTDAALAVFYAKDKPE
jgi:hypothetical protein